MLLGVACFGQAGCHLALQLCTPMIGYNNPVAGNLALIDVGWGLSNSCIWQPLPAPHAR